MAVTAKTSSHVPKFGNWDTDDVPYTICFQNARELSAAGKSFDPNDPDDYPPEAFVPATTTTTTTISSANRQSVSADLRRHHTIALDGRGGDYQRRPRQRDHGRDRNGSSGSERLSSERSGSDYALLKGPKQSEGRVGRKKNGVEGISRFTPTVGGNGGNPNPSRVRQHEGEMASVPKFGSWDARDPKSGDGYTAIFNKVKMEKQIAASNLQAMPPLPNQTKQPISQTSHGGSTSFVSKICCCLCPPK